MRIWGTQPGLKTSGPSITSTEGGWYPEPAIRSHRAELLETSGREEDAAWLYRSFLPPHRVSFYTVLAGERLSGE